MGVAPPDGGVQDTDMVLLLVKLALRSVGGLGAAVYDRLKYVLLTKINQRQRQKFPDLQ